MDEVRVEETRRTGGWEIHARRYAADGLGDGFELAEHLAPRDALVGRAWVLVTGRVPGRAGELARQDVNAALGGDNRG